MQKSKYEKIGGINLESICNFGNSHRKRSNW